MNPVHCVRVRGRTNRLETGQTRTAHTSFSTSSCRECPSGKGRTRPVAVSAVSCVRDREVQLKAAPWPTCPTSSWYRPNVQLWQWTAVEPLCACRYTSDT